MSADLFGWIFIGTVAAVLGALTIREDLLRRDGK